MHDIRAIDSNYHNKNNVIHIECFKSHYSEIRRGKLQDINDMMLISNWRLERNVMVFQNIIENSVVRNVVDSHSTPLASGNGLE
jgi:hypothetical protein